MAVNPNTDFTAGAVLTAAQQNRFPRGIVGDASTTTAYNLTGTLADVTGLSVTFTAAADRLYLATFHCLNALNGTAGDFRGQIRLTYASTDFARAYAGAMTFGYPLTVLGLFEPGAGSVTVKVRAYYDSGTGGQFYADANSPMRLIVEDVGPF